MKKEICTSLAPNPVANFSQGLQVDNRVYIAGQTPIDKKTGEIDESIKEQTKQIFKNISYILKEVDASLSDIVKVTVYMTDLSQFDDFNEAYNEIITVTPFPIRTTIGCNLKGIPIEIDVIAEV